jgi:toxin ParE1/3/4
MATEDNTAERRIVLHTAGSRLDLISIYQYNEVIYGAGHAERYLDFLDSQMQFLADHPGSGRTVEQRPGVRVFVARVRQRRSAAGHRVFYREMANGIEVIRVLHTAMNWPDHL